MDVSAADGSDVFDWKSGDVGVVNVAGVCDGGRTGAVCGGGWRSGFILVCNEVNDRLTVTCIVIVFVIESINS